MGADSDHPWRPLSGLYCCAKFGWNWCSSFDNMKLSIFCPFGLKTPIHAPKIGVFGDFNPKMGSNVNETPKRHILARVRVVWAIKCENPSTGLTCRKKGINKKKFRYISPICPEAPRRSSCAKFGTAVGAGLALPCSPWYVHVAFWMRWKRHCFDTTIPVFKACAIVFFCLLTLCVKFLQLVAFVKLLFGILNYIKRNSLCLLTNAI